MQPFPLLPLFPCTDSPSLSSFTEHQGPQSSDPLYSVPLFLYFDTSHPLSVPNFPSSASLLQSIPTHTPRALQPVHVPSCDYDPQRLPFRSLASPLRPFLTLSPLHFPHLCLCPLAPQRTIRNPLPSALALLV